MLNTKVSKLESKAVLKFEVLTRINSFRYLSLPISKYKIIYLTFDIYFILKKKDI
jgi:hypothetical protein